ncbi:hypothetical protein C8N46_102320 [Kordia periserrulae]|jgi:hypothetical protein|uniref:Uncharacterized protein n=1 Tax=Kordia periserrulae TaxID=701523 RepID=A0A2T6C3L2_9FLAO|nr:hypothetical protein [Kordia periserrulae]PTX62919.1 hypothetical protein C8N46_102320 [Kordia periserrulae]
MKKKKQLGKLKLSKKTIGNLSELNGGRPPGSYNCVPYDPQPYTIETVCWTQSRDIASECWCSSDDSFFC